MIPDGAVDDPGFDLARWFGRRALLVVEIGSGVGEATAVLAAARPDHDVLALEPYFDDGTIAQPRYLPPWVQHARGLAGMLAFSLFANRIRLDRVEAEDLVLGV